MTVGDEPIALAAYEALADGYAAIAETKAENGYNEFPAMRAALGDVRGQTVLDAGCGPGFLVRDLICAGTRRVVGLDISPRMIAHARARVGTAAEVHVADLGRPLDFLEDGMFDVVASSLALDHVRDWQVPLTEFRRLLTSSGRLVFTVQHPMGAYEWMRPPTAFGVHSCEATWKGFTDTPVVVPDHYRSVAEIINPVLAAGFRLRRVEETRPVSELSAINPRKYAEGMRWPTFLLIEADAS